MTNETLEIDALKEKDGGGEVVQAVEELEPLGEKRIRLARQVGLVCMVTLAYVSLGAIITWPSPALSSLAENNATLVGTEVVFNSTQKDMTGSLAFVGTLLGAWLAGLAVNRLGRLISLRIIVVPYLVGWIVTALAPTTSVLLIGRFVVGLASGGTTIAGYAYVIELSDVNIRGMMATIPTMGVVLGSLYTVAFGYVLPWHYLSIVCALPPFLFLICTFFLPASPSFLVVRGRRQQAIAILTRLRGRYADVEAEVLELEHRNAVNSGTKRSSWRDMLERDVLHRMGVVITLFVLMQLCGNFVLMSYTARILEATGASMDPDAITVIAGVLRVAGTLTAILVLDVIGRRYCLIISHAINACCLILLGVYVYLAEHADPTDDTYKNLTWVPTVCVTMSLFICDVGVHPVPFIVSSEYFPTSIRAQASSVCISTGTIATFLALQLYSVMQEALTQPGLYWFYGAMSVFGVVFSFVAVIETKGKTVG